VVKAKKENGDLKVHHFVVDKGYGFLKSYNLSPLQHLVFLFVL
jgi:hypothetical protein